MNYCEYCNEGIFDDKDRKCAPDNLPDDIPWQDNWDVMYYHSWCFEDVIADERSEIASKHGHG
jgi:hypothetical protein